MEGTPGYQAPEVRPGIVYDEKVLTSFSYPTLSLSLLSVLVFVFVVHKAPINSGAVVSFVPSVSWSLYMHPNTHPK